MPESPSPVDNGVDRVGGVSAVSSGGSNPVADAHASVTLMFNPEADLSHGNVILVSDSEGIPRPSVQPFEWKWWPPTRTILEALTPVLTFLPVHLYSLTPRLKRRFLMTTASSVKRPVPRWRFVWSYICLGVAVAATAYLIYSYSVHIPKLLKSNPADPGWASLGFFMTPIIIGPFTVIPMIASIILRWTWLNITGLAVILMLLPVPYVFDAVGVTRPFLEL